MNNDPMTVMNIDSMMNAIAARKLTTLGVTVIHGDVICLNGITHTVVQQVYKVALTEATEYYENS